MKTSWGMILGGFLLSFAQVSSADTLNVKLDNAASPNLPPLSSYFNQKDLQHFKPATQVNGCPEIATFNIEELSVKHPIFTIDRAPVDDRGCHKGQPNRQTYKLYKRFSDCGKVVYTNDPNVSLDEAEIVIVDGRTSTCDGQPSSDEVVIRQMTDNGAEFFHVK